MEATITLQLAQRGLITLPKSLREAYRLKPGDILTLLDLGGVFVISPMRSEVDTLSSQISELLVERGETLESMIKALREVREGYQGEQKS